jgi:site-specific DNA recombinase
MRGAPYGYRYIRKTDEAPAFYRVIDAEARVVQRVYARPTVAGLSIGEIIRRLNAQGSYAIPPVAEPLRLVKQASPAEFE